MVQQRQPERQLIADALAIGHESIMDEHGFRHGFYAVCPKDGQHAHPDRTVWKRDVQGRHIDHLIMRCNSCGHVWRPAVDDLHLY